MDISMKKFTVIVKATATLYLELECESAEEAAEEAEHQMSEELKKLAVYDAEISDTDVFES